MVHFDNPHTRRDGINALRIVSHVLDKHNIQWSLGHGTLMGAIRSNALLPICTDIDIDTFNVSKDIVMAIKNDIDRYLPFEDLRDYHDTYYLLAYRLNFMRLDIHFWYSKNDGMYRADTHKPAPNGHVFYRLPSYIFNTLMPYRFMNIDTYIPEYAEDYLDIMYEKDMWRQDRTGWHTKRDSPCLIAEEECPIYE